MSIRRILAACVCKLSYKVLRLCRRGATSLPGKLALKIDPNYLNFLARGVKTIVVTGTNGKTTTAHIIAAAFANTGQPAFYNRSGANLIQGITTEFALHSTLTGHARFAFAVIECDEGALRRVCAACDPQVLVVTNIFRDQLDRYGEIMHTRDNILAGIRLSPHAVVCLNADDPIVSSLASELPNKLVYYGLDCEIYPKRVSDLSDATHCIFCGAPYVYDYVTYAHLGGFHCTGCGYSRKSPDFAIKRILKRQIDTCVVELAVLAGEKQSSYELCLDVCASYDIYNCIAAITGLISFGFQREDAFMAAQKFQHGFGRSELFDIDGTQLRLMLMKNPAGCNQIINLLLNVADKNMGLVCILNDQECDGVDVSWIYDVAWEALSTSKNEVICAGQRAYDMALRLKYAGVEADSIRIISDYKELIACLGRRRLPCTVLANYSAMLEFRKALASALDLPGFWEG